MKNDFALYSQFDHVVSHFDGNNRDPDDIAGVPIAAALINAAGLQDKSTFFYNNNVGQQNNSKRVKQMRESAAFANKLGIQTYDYQADLNGTTKELAKIFNSGKQVLVLEGGRMEMTYRALEQTSPANLKNITLLSHSAANENYNKGGTRNWEDLQQDFRDVTFLTITDQNGGFNSSKWKWLDSTSDPILKEARELMRNADHKVDDPSDAGMQFYALTGNEGADPINAKDFFDKYSPSQKSSIPVPLPSPKSSPEPTSQQEPVAPSSEPEPLPKPSTNQSSIPRNDANSPKSLFTFALVDATTDKVVKGYENLGATPTINLNNLGLKQFNLLAKVNSDYAGANAVKSVKFESNLGNSVENVVPYALFGDRNGDFKGKSLSTGSYTIKAKAYTQQGGKGTVIGATDLSYAVISSALSPAPDSKPPSAESPVSTPDSEPPSTPSAEPPASEPVSKPVSTPPDIKPGDMAGDGHGNHGMDNHDMGTVDKPGMGDMGEHGQTVLWSNIDKLLGSTPQDGDDVIIPDGLKVVLDTDTPKIGNLVVHGEVMFGETDVTLTADNVIVFGELRAGSENKPHTHKAEIILTGRSTDPDVVLADWVGDAKHSGHGMAKGNHAGHMTNPIDNKALIVAPGGKLNLHGAKVDSWTQLNATANSGDTSITLKDAPVGWNVGDEIAIAPTDFNAFEVEERVITDIQGSTVFFDKPLEYGHYGEQQDLGNGKRLDMRAEVTNLSRNIIITGSEDGETKINNSPSNPDDYTRSGYGGHTVYMTDSEVKLDGVEFSKLGLSGELGGYPVHFHHTGDATGSYVKNSSIHHTFQRGLVVHQTDNLLVEGNTIYDTMSHSYFIEDGVETGNRFVDNLAMLPRSTTEEFRIDNPDNGMRKFERASGFWITNQANAFEGNHVAGVPSGHGFWFIAPDNASRTAVKKNDPKGNLPLEQFEGNTAHTLMTAGGNLGYRFDWTGNALELSTSFDTHQDNAAIEDFTAWKVGNMAIQIAPNRTVDIEDPILAEARTMIQSASRGHNGSSLLEVLNPTFVAETENTMEGRTLSSFFGKKFPGPSIGLSERPIEFTNATIIGEDQLKVSGRKEFKDQLTFQSGVGATPASAKMPKASSNLRIVVDANIDDMLPGLGEQGVLVGGQGADKFVLGNASKVFYNDGDPSTAGKMDFALIKDFKLSQGDVIQLHGEASDYRLGNSPVGNSEDTAIFLKSSGQDELVGSIQNGKKLNLSLDSAAFDFV